VPLSPQTSPASVPEMGPAKPLASHVLFVGMSESERRQIVPFFQQQRSDPLLADPARSPAAASFAVAESILDALFVSGNAMGGNGGGGGSDQAFTAILIAVAAEIDHLETGIRSLRRVNPEARIVLFCEPADEANCRAALEWGADDYYLLPLDDRDLRKAAALNRRGAPAQAGGDQAQNPALLALPLAVQTELLEELMEGAGLTAKNAGPAGDFGRRAADALARHLHLPGSLLYIPDAPIPDPRSPRPAGTLLHPVALTGQRPFGLLEFTPAAGAAVDDAAISGMLSEAAQWLAAMLTLAQRYQQLRTLAITDELSGAYNRRYFMKFMTGLLERARDNHSRVTLLLFDIDDFKKYNDAFGHAAGDAIIRELIKLLRACTREYDLVARIGGDEFAVVYRDNEAPRQPNSQHPRDVLVATERFRDAIRNHQWPQICKIKGEISISGGLANFPTDADTLEALMAKADQALLKAKAAGKNVILLHAKEPAIGVMPPAQLTRKLES